jgi:hypothetical protein
MDPRWNNFCVFILTHGRPDNVITYRTLRRDGYDGPIYIVVDDEKDRASYAAVFGQEFVIAFDKEKAIADTDDFGDFNKHNMIIYARNACFSIAEKLGVTYFMELDDDYTNFKFRMNEKFQLPESCPSLRNTLGDAIFTTLEFYKSIPALTVAFSQGGDWMGAKSSPPDFFAGKFAFNQRKCMNSFFCSTERKFKFVSGMNEDVSTYVMLGSTGGLFLTVPHVQFDQKTTQKQAGGATDIYLLLGTYVKSFHTVLCSPSCVTLTMMGETSRRIHHRINWDCAVPMLISEKFRK